MKKSFFICLMLITIFSCKKQNVKVANLIDPAYPVVKVANKHLVFANRDDFDRSFSLNFDKLSTLLISLKGFSGFIAGKESILTPTLRTHMPEIERCDVPPDVIENNLAFFSVLDQNGVVQIGDYLYRYDYCTGKIYVISSANGENANEYTDFLHGITTNSSVGVFPDYVDVLEAVANGYKTMPAENAVQGNVTFQRSLLPLFDKLLEDLRFNEVGTLNKSDKVRMDGKLSYDKFGIYFHFYGKEKFQRRSSVAWYTSDDGPRDWFVNFEYKYFKKGRNSDDIGSGTLWAPRAGENKVDKTFYEGSRGLMTFYAKWDIDVYSDYVKVSRNAGSEWEDIFENRLFLPARMQNYIRGFRGAKDQYHYLVNNN